MNQLNMQLHWLQTARQVEYRTALPPRPSNHVLSTSLHHVLPGLVGSSPESFNSGHGRPLWCRHGIGRVSPSPTAVYLAVVTINSSCLVRWGRPGLCRDIQCLVASAWPHSPWSLSPLIPGWRESLRTAPFGSSSLFDSYPLGCNYKKRSLVGNGKMRYTVPQHPFCD